jgi:Replication-relaxation
VPDAVRPRVRAEDALRLAGALTDRDRQIAADCLEHRVLTTDQLRRLHFTETRTAIRRLGKLRTLRVLDRFRPPWQRGAGSPPYHWVLDAAGAHVVAASRGIDRAALGWSRQPVDAIAGSATLAHRITTNEFATLLIAEHRAAGGEVPEWRGERGAHDLLGGIVVPDSYLVLERPGDPALHLLLETDRGTEDHGRLLTKARRYAKAIPRSRIADADSVVLLIVRTARRARAVATTLADGPWPMAIEVWAPGGESPRELTLRAARS